MPKIDETTPIDIEALKRLTGADDITFAREMLATFKGSEHETAIKLDQLIISEKSTEVHRAAHAAKGAARSVCAKALADLCEDLEHTSRRGDWQKAKTLGSEIHKEFQKVMSFIDHFLASAP